MQQIQPRVFDSKGAAAYINFSLSFIKNTRLDDVKRLESGEPIHGPEWRKVGRHIKYFREDLDAWLTAIHEGNHPAWAASDFQPDTSGLKHQSVA